MWRSKVGIPFLLTSLLLNAGCSTSSSQFVVRSSMRFRSTPQTDDDSRVLEGTAGNLLRVGATVAFFPPDNCLDVSAAPSGSQGQSRYLRNNCGVLMSELEKAAAQVGLKVVSWQALKGNPLGRARELHVDALIEVDELGLQFRDPQKDTVSTFTFTEETAEGSKPLVVSNTEAVAIRCRLQVSRLGQRKEEAAAATLAIKMVGVDDGRAKWFYKKTIQKSQDEEVKIERRFEGASKRNWPLYAFGIPGGVLMLAGVAELDSDSAKAKSNASTFILLGAAAIGTGLLLRGNNKPNPDEVLCNPSKELTVVPAAEAPVDRSGSGAQVVDVEVGGQDKEAEQQAVLIRAIVRKFVEQLDVVRQSAQPEAAPPPTAKPPSSAPPKPPTAPVKPR